MLSLVKRCSIKQFVVVKKHAGMGGGLKKRGGLNKFLASERGGLNRGLTVYYDVVLLRGYSFAALR